MKDKKEEGDEGDIERKKELGGRKWGQTDKRKKDEYEDEVEEECEVFKCFAVSTGFQLINLYR